MSNDAADEAERRLRLRAEAAVALVAARPAEIAVAISGLNDAAEALVGAGLLPLEVTSAIVAETIDALFVRGADWLEPAWPELETSRLSLMVEEPPPSLTRATDASGGSHAGDPALYFDRLVLRTIALVDVDLDVDMVNSLRGRLSVSAEALGLPDAMSEAALRAFDSAVVSSEVRW